MKVRAIPTESDYRLVERIATFLENDQRLKRLDENIACAARVLVEFRDEPRLAALYKAERGCETCKGLGRVWSTGIFTERPCERCSGTGRLPHDEAPVEPSAWERRLFTEGHVAHVPESKPESVVALVVEATKAVDVLEKCARETAGLTSRAAGEKEMEGALDSLLACRKRVRAALLALAACAQPTGPEPDDAWYADLEKDLNNLERTDPAVKAAADNVARVSSEIVKSLTSDDLERWAESMHVGDQAEPLRSPGGSWSKQPDWYKDVVRRRAAAMLKHRLGK